MLWAGGEFVKIAAQIATHRAPYSLVRNFYFMRCLVRRSAIFPIGPDRTVWIYGILQFHKEKKNDEKKRRNKVKAFKCIVITISYKIRHTPGETERD